MTQLEDNKVRAEKVSSPSKTMRLIRRGSFSTTDRGEEWAYTFHATWWHQLRGVMGFHDRLFFGRAPKSDFPAPPTVDDLAVIYNETTEYTWQVSE